MPKANFYLDHICDNIVSSNDAMLDNWAHQSFDLNNSTIEKTKVSDGKVAL